METKIKDAYVQFRLPQSVKDDLQEVSSKAGVSESLIVRTAVRQILRDLKQQIKEGKGVKLELCP